MNFTQSERPQRRKSVTKSSQMMKKSITTNYVNEEEEGVTADYTDFH